MNPFHLSLGVKSTGESAHFFEQVLGAKVTHRDVTGYININFYGHQITLKENLTINPDELDLHFGINLPLEEFRSLVQAISDQHSESILAPLSVVDAGTEMERQKLILKCPSGYLIELKGYQCLDNASK